MLNTARRIAGRNVAGQRPQIEHLSGVVMVTAMRQKLNRTPAVQVPEP
jgi:hypothetical protein